MSNSSDSKFRRLFIGISVPKAIANDIASLEHPLDDAKWHPAENLHITLRFLGNCDESRYKNITRYMPQVRSKPFLLQTQSIGFWAPQILWIGVRRTIELVDCKEAVDKTIKQAGFEEDRKDYNPHITIARLKKHHDQKQLNRFLDKYARCEFPQFEVKKIHLYESVTYQEGPVYNILESYRLR